MKLTAFSFPLLAVGFLITTPSYHGVLGQTSNTSAALAVLSNCPKSQCLTDAISCLANAGGNPNDESQARKLEKLEKEVASLKALLARAGKPSGFAVLDSNGRLNQSLLAAGYDKYSLYDLGWQSLHMAAAAACRGSTSSGGSGCCHNVVLVRNAADKKTCAQICAQSPFRNCDAELSIHGKTGKATHNGEQIGSFYNYYCSEPFGGGSEVSRSVSDITRYPDPYPYYSFCCCRK
ncbi:uncharacterized protein [Montipora capricornis]|uniref:uncharacterized protein n=1 Tax=Montipora capricornis TaxID=246305 RepID=UPI0035F2174E